MTSENKTYEQLKEELKTLIIPMIEKISTDHYDHRALNSIITNIKRYSETIICDTCKIGKPRKKYNDGRLTCNSCIKDSEYHKKYYEKNKEKIKIKNTLKNTQKTENIETLNIV